MCLESFYILNYKFEFRYFLKFKCFKLSLNLYIFILKFKMEQIKTP